MGAKQSALASMLAGSGNIAKGSVTYPTLRQVIASPYAHEIERIYRNLGGVLPTFPVGFRGWDIEFEGMAVELDEELHFNRYRALTLGSELYDELPSFPREHRTRLRTNNPLEKLMREIKRRTKVVGAFPDCNSAVMLSAARLRHVAGTRWSMRKYLDIDRLVELVREREQQEQDSMTGVAV